MELGWIDFSKSDRNKVFNVLSLLSEEGVLDELGIAPIRDAFSNIFFPGITTVQTRAKYFLIVPYAFRDLELSGITDVSGLEDELERIEKESAILMFNKNSEERGIIGSSTIPKGWVQRPPSSVYLAGLRTYGIFKRGVSLNAYLKQISKANKEKVNFSNSRNQNSDDEGYHDDRNAGDRLSLGILNVISHNNWREDLTINLTREEGDFLKHQIISNCPKSLIAFILENNINLSEIDSFYDFQSIELPIHLQKYYDMAIEFSEFNHALAVIYNLIASQNKNKDALKEYDKLDFFELSKINIDEIMNELNVKNPILRSFLNSSRQQMKNNDMDGLKENIINREKKLKTVSRSRLSNPSEVDSDKWYAGGKLDYRFGIAKDIITDIFGSETDGE